MSFSALFTSIYQLYYKADIRQAFMERGEVPAGLSEAEAALLRAIDPARLQTIVDLHGPDIWAGWYAERFGATWEALRVLLREESNRSLVARLCNSDAFEERTNDDRDGSALWAFIEEQKEEHPESFENAPWLEELFNYESMLSEEADYGPDAEFSAQIARFEWRVDALIERERPWAKLPKRKGIAKPYWALIGSCPYNGLSEVEIAEPLMVGVLSRLLDTGLEEEALLKDAGQKEIAHLEVEARNLLLEMSAGED